MEQILTESRLSDARGRPVPDSTTQREVIFSVIIPVYNMEQYLAASLGSWLGQTLPEIELICIDDGSTDNSYACLERLAASDTRIITERFETNRSAWMARKRGIALARGKYIMFADADDEVLPDTCRELFRELQSNPTDILHFCMEIVNVNQLPQERIDANQRYLTPYDGVLRGKEIFTACFREKKYAYNLSAKVFTAALCRKMAEHAPDGSFPKAQDKLAYFMLSYFADSYRGLLGRKYYLYFFGRGGTGQYKLNHQQFERYCSQVRVADAQYNFLASQNALEEYGDTVTLSRKMLLSECIHRWKKDVPDTDKPAMFTILLQYWRPAEVIGALAETERNNQARVTEWIKGSAALSFTRKELRTIATYYNRCSNGGIQRVMCQLCELWVQMGYNVVLITDEPPVENEYPLPQSVQRVWIGNSQSVPDKGYSSRAEALLEILTKYEVDALVYQAWLHPLLLWDTLVCKTRGIAFIPHCHGVFTVGLCEGWSNMQAVITPYSLADAIVTLSETDLCFWRYYNNNVHKTINPFTESITAWQPDMSRSNHHIVWVGRLSSVKRPVDALYIIKGVLARIPDVVLHIVGSSPDGSMEKSLSESIHALALDGHVILEGFQMDVKPFYMKASLFLMTTFYDGYPLTLQESKLAGLPCVMYEQPYLTLCQGNHGIVAVPQGDIQAAANAVSDLLSDEEKRLQLAHAAREHVESLFGFDFQKSGRTFLAACSRHIQIQWMRRSA